jgi:hypothetical protein
MTKYTREQELVLGIASYLTDWTDDELSTMPIEDSIGCIESYGIKFNNSCNELVTNAIRHIQYIINPWNADEIWMILIEIGFTKKETIKYGAHER